MADSRSPAFTPPINRLVENDPQIVKVPMEKVGFGWRSPNTPKLSDNGLGIKHVKG